MSCAGKADELDAVLAAVSATGFGLTLGIHSRIDGFQRRIAAALPVGNVYVNRSTIGAVVGVAALRRAGPVGHGAEGWRPALPAALCDREDGVDQHGGRRR